MLDPKARLRNLDAIDAQAKYVLKVASEPLEQRLASCVVALVDEVRKLRREVESQQSARRRFP